MTVRDMLNLYQSWIDDYLDSRIRIASLGNEPEADSFYAGIITGFNNAYILLQKHEKEGLEPCSN